MPSFDKSFAGEDSGRHEVVLTGQVLPGLRRLSRRNCTDIDLMASRTTIMRKLDVYYRDSLTAAQNSDTPRCELIGPDDEVFTLALVFGTLVTIGTVGAANPIADVCFGRANKTSTPDVISNEI